MLTASATAEAVQRRPQRDEVFEVVVVRDLAPQPLPHRFDWIQVRTVGRQEPQAQARLRLHEHAEAGTAMPGRSIEHDDDQDPWVGPQELMEESLAVGRREPRRQTTMELARHRVERPKTMDLLMRTRPIPGQGLLAGEPPLPAERGGELHGHLVLEQDHQALGPTVGEAQESSELSFFSRRRQAGIAGS